MLRDIASAAALAVFCLALVYGSAGFAALVQIGRAVQ